MQKFKIIFHVFIFMCFSLYFVYFVFAGNLDPDSSPGDTMKTLEDIYCRITVCSPASYGLNSSDAPGSIMFSLRQIYDVSIPPVYYGRQKYQIYDDYNCTNNNAELNSTCSVGDPEYTGEEGHWIMYNDTNLGGALVASGRVYFDQITRLYWSDCHGLPSSGCIGLSNYFIIGSGCSGAQIIAGECDASMYETKGNAIQFCIDLSLDADGDGNDETDWRLPTQKELLQAYINGANNNLPNISAYWSSTKSSTNVRYAWLVWKDGQAYPYTHDGEYNFGVRCVRP